MSVLVFGALSPVPALPLLPTHAPPRGAGRWVLTPLRPIMMPACTSGTAVPAPPLMWWWTLEVRACVRAQLLLLSCSPAIEATACNPAVTQCCAQLTRGRCRRCMPAAGRTHCLKPLPPLLQTGSLPLAAWFQAAPRATACGCSNEGGPWCMCVPMQRSEGCCTVLCSTRRYHIQQYQQDWPPGCSCCLLLSL